MIVVADTGALYALADRSDAWHQRVRDWWVAAPRRVVIPTSVVPELCRLLQTRLGAQAELAFVRAIRTREFQLVEVEGRDLPRIEAGGVERVGHDRVPIRDAQDGFGDTDCVEVACGVEAVRRHELSGTSCRHGPDRAAPRLIPVR